MTGVATAIYTCTAAVFATAAVGLTYALISYPIPGIFWALVASLTLAAVMLAIQADKAR